MKYLTLFVFTLLNTFIYSQKQTTTIELTPFSFYKFSDRFPAFYKDGFLFSSDRNVDSEACPNIVFPKENNPKNKYSKRKNIQIYSKRVGKIKFSSSKFITTFYYNFKTKKIESQLINDTGFDISSLFYDRRNDLIYATNYNLTEYKSYFTIKTYKIKEKNIILNKSIHLYYKGCSNFAHATIHDNKLLVTAFSKSGKKNVLLLYKFEKKWVLDKKIYSSKALIISPFYLNKKTIVFASKLKGGKGGIDLYKIVYNDNKWSKPINLELFNSPFDDFSIIFLNETEGYLSSNRLGNKDHIFKFKLNINQNTFLTNVPQPQKE